MTPDNQTPLGATLLDNGRCRFRVWAPFVETLEVGLLPEKRWAPLAKREDGHHEGVLNGVADGARYLFRLDGKVERPDPCSRFQPDGVHGPSAVVGPMRGTDNGWRGLPLRDFVIYELHVGTFTPEGTFDAVIPHLPRLKDLGVTAVELMPVSQFPGSRNWGYDGVYPFAAQESYGGPMGLRRLVDACHRTGMAAVLDVVYNHMGPEGNVLRDFGPFFTDRYKTPWGDALNFDGPHSDPVRRFFIENALMWITDMGFDALRLDAVHAIYDFSAYPFLAELGDAVHLRAERLGRTVHVIAESDLNDARIIHSKAEGGFALSAQWSDDFHHALHALLTGEVSGYYEDFGALEDLAAAMTRGFVYDGRPSRHRKRRHGNATNGLHPSQFVVSIQNHDQVGNRLLGERLSQLVDFERLKLAAGTTLLSPFIPLLFMGEEHGETAPFPYFISHGDPDLIAAVRRGRRDEFASFGWKEEPPDPQAEDTFRRALLREEAHLSNTQRTLRDLYQTLIALRRAVPALLPDQLTGTHAEIVPETRALLLRRGTGATETAALFHFGDKRTAVSLPLTPGRWETRIDSAQRRWDGPGSDIPDTIDAAGEVEMSVQPFSFVLFVRHQEERE